MFASIVADTAVTANFNFAQFHPYETYGAGKGPALNVVIANADNYVSCFSSIVLVNRKLAHRRRTNAANIYSYIIGGMVAVP